MGAPPSGGRVLSLRNDSFEPHLAGVGEDGRAVVLGVLVGTDAGASLGQHACKRGFADLKRIAPTLDQPQFNGNKRSASDFLPCDPQNDELSESFMTEVSIRKRFGVVADEQQRENPSAVEISFPGLAWSIRGPLLASARESPRAGVSPPLFIG